MEDFTKVREEIETRTTQTIEGRHNVSDVCIVINIHSQHYPDNLQLVDLPGKLINSSPLYPYSDWRGGVKMTRSTILSYAATKIHIDGLPNFLTFPKMVTRKF